MSIESLVEPLRRVVLFQGLGPAQINEIARRAERVLFKPGDAIIKKGEAGEAAFLIVSGKAERTAGPGNAESEELQPGSLVGEMAMLVETEFSSTVVCREAVKALKITRSALLEQMSCDLALADHILEKLADRLKQLANELRQINGFFGSGDQPQPSPADAGRLIAFEPRPDAALDLRPAP